MKITAAILGSLLSFFLLYVGDAGAQTPADSNTVQGIGYIEPVSEVRRIVFESDGVIAVCKVREGDKVKAGNLLMKLRDERQAAQVVVCEKELALAEATRAKILSGVNQNQIAAAEKRVNQAKEREAYLKKEFDRATALVEKAVSSNTEKDRAENALKEARENLKAQEEELASLVQFVRKEDRDVADCQVRVAEANLECSKQELKKTELLAPIDGTILQLFKFPGEGVSHLDTAPVLLIADTSHLRVTAEIDERYVSLLKPGQEASVWERGKTNANAVQGRVTRVGGIMGKKQLLSRAANELRDLDVVEIWIEIPETYSAPLGLQVDVAVKVK